MYSIKLLVGCYVNSVFGRTGSCVAIGINTILHLHATCFPISITRLLSSLFESATYGSQSGSVFTLFYAPCDIFYIVDHLYGSEFRVKGGRDMDCDG